MGKSHGPVPGNEFFFSHGVIQLRLNPTVIYNLVPQL